MRAKYVYKVVEVLRNGKMVSCIVYRYNRKYCLNYELNKTTKAVAGSVGILIFKSLRSARYFKNQYFSGPVNDHIILRCRCKNATKKPIKMLGWENKIASFYKEMVNPFILAYVANIMAAPKGTYACEELTPVSIVEEK